MSFGKAKLHRFNDEKPCAPSPGAYNPVIPDKSVGPIINKTERFIGNRQMIHASSSESLNSLYSEKGTSCTGSFSTFKTPRIPSRFRVMSLTNARRKCEFSQQKITSTNLINKKISHNDYKINSSLTYSLNMIQEELTIKKGQNQKLVDQLNQAKEDNAEANIFSDWLVHVISKKDKLIDLLKEKCTSLQSFTDECIESYQEYVKNICSVLHTHYELSLKTDLDLTNLIERYEKLVCEYEQDIDIIFVFLVDLLQKRINVSFESVRSDNFTDQYNNLVEILKETERGRRKYEIIVQELQKVISVLSGRVHESDKEVEKMCQVVHSLTEEKIKLTAGVLVKEEEISAMRNIIETINKKFVNEVRYTESGLLKLIDEFQSKAIREKCNYDKTISDLIQSKNEKELQLQEALDLIDVQKCKEELLHQRLDQTHEIHEKYMLFEHTLQQCHQRLVQWEIGNDRDEIPCIDISLEKSELLESAKKLVEFMVRSELIIDEYVHNLNNVESVREFVSILQDILMSTFEHECITDKTLFVRRLLDVIFKTFSKLGCEVYTLKSDLSRIRDDFIEKCNECAQLTRLLQLSEKKIEISKNTEQEYCEDQWQIRFNQFQQTIDSLQKEKTALEHQLNETKLRTEQRETCVYALNEGLTQINENEDDRNEQIMKLEDILKNERKKVEALEVQNSRLLELIGPYHQVLEKYESESKILAQKSDPNVIQKHLKLLNYQNHEIKTKQIIMKPKNEIQLKKKFEDQNRKFAPKNGKENRVVNKTKEIADARVRLAVAKVAVNSTYIVTSPKIGRI